MKAGNDLLLRRDRGGIATLTMNRPRQRNALSGDLMAAMQDALDAAAEDSSVKAVVIAGAGPAFCAGHDLREMRAMPGRQALEALFGQCSRLMLSILKLPKPVIAKVQGMATAAGCQLVATCDLAVASTAARFATPGVNIGLF
ncbi:MAG: enoyl-CoA hydratase-related protein, partial [Rhodospirillales bacterium]